MATPISELVHFIGEDTQAVRRAKEAVGWLAKKPAIIEVLEEAKRLHGKPLPISVSPLHLSAGYGVMTATGELEHAVHYNPALFDGIKLKAVDGTHITFSHERFLAHEFKHASQPDALKNGVEYAARKQRIGEEIAAEFPVPQSDPEKFMHRFAAAKDDPQQARRVFEDMYDEVIAPRIPIQERAQAAAMDRIKKDPKITRYFQQFEEPAIAFENQIMHGLEPARITDYVDSQDLAKGMAQLKDKEAWVNENLAAYMDNFKESKGLAEAKAAKEAGPAQPAQWAERVDYQRTNASPNLPE